MMRLLASALLAAALAAPAVAQPAPAGTDPHHPAATEPAPAEAPGAMGMMGMMSGMECPMMGGHTEGVLAFLKTELKITQAQSAAWEAFAKAYRDFVASQPHKSKMGGGMMEGGKKNVGPGGPMMGGKGPAAMPFPERLSARTQMMEGRVAAQKKLEAAVRPLYAALSPEQKQSADRLLPMFTMMGGMMMGGAM